MDELSNVESKSNMYLHLTSVHPTSKQVFFFQFTFFNVNIMAVRFGRSIMFRKIMLQNPAWFRKSLIHTSTIADPPRVLITGKWNCKVFRVYIWYIQNMCYVLTITTLTYKTFDEKDSLGVDRVFTRPVRLDSIVLPSQVPARPDPLEWLKC